MKILGQKGVEAFEGNSAKMLLKDWDPLKYILVAQTFLSVTKLWQKKLKIMHFDTIFKLTSDLCPCPIGCFYLSPISYQISISQNLVSFC